MFSFRNHLGYNDRVVVIPEIPRECPVVDVTLAQVLELASVNNPFSRDILCRQLEARQQIAMAKANRGFRADLYASIGYTGNGPKFKHAYQDLRSREMVSLELVSPFLTGKRAWKSRTSPFPARNRGKSIETGKHEL